MFFTLQKGQQYPHKMSLQYLTLPVKATSYIASKDESKIDFQPFPYFCTLLPKH